MIKYMVFKGKAVADYHGFSFEKTTKWRFY